MCIHTLKLDGYRRDVAVTALSHAGSWWGGRCWDLSQLTRARGGVN